MGRAQEPVPKRKAPFPARGPRGSALQAANAAKKQMNTPLLPIVSNGCPPLVAHKWVYGVTEQWSAEPWPPAQWNEGDVSPWGFPCFVVPAGWRLAPDAPPFPPFRPVRPGPDRDGPLKTVAPLDEFSGGA